MTTPAPGQGTLPGVVPVPGSTRCLLPARYGARVPCSRPAVGTVPDFTAPLDPELATPACIECADLYRTDLEPWLL